MGVVHHHAGVVFFGQTDDFRKIGDIAGHAEDAIGHDEFAFFGVGRRKFFFEIGHVTVFVANHRRETQPNAVVDRRMIFPVGENQIVATGNRRQNAEIALKTGRESDASFFV